MAKIKNDGTWFVKFPTYKYNEDVKKLAKRNDLYVIDEKYQGDMEQVTKAPKLTINKNFIPAKTEIEKLKEANEALVAELAKKG